MKYITLIITLFYSVTVNSQTPPIPGTPEFVNLPPFTSPQWTLQNSIFSGSVPFNLANFDYVTVSGPSISIANPLNPTQWGRASINPPEHQQNSTNVYHTLSFWYKWDNIGFTYARVKINGLFYCNIPRSSAWKKFSTNINYTIVNELSFECVNNGQLPYYPIFRIDAVQWTPRYSAPTQVSNNTNFIVIPTISSTTIKWNQSVYPGGVSGFKLWGQTNIGQPFYLITNTATLSNAWYYVYRTNGMNEYFQLWTP